MAKQAIARRLGLDIKTVRKWLARRWRPQKRSGRVRALDRFAEFLHGRAPEVGFNAQVLYREVVQAGYRGSYSSLVRYIRTWRKA